MSAPNPTDRALIAKLAAHSRWATEENRTAALAPARRGMRAKWEREADPDGVLTPAELERRVEQLRKAHMTRMSLRAAQARRARKGQAA